MTEQFMLWIAIAGLFFTVLGLFLTLIGLSIGFYFRIRNLNLKIEEQTSIYKQTLYCKQLEGYIEIAEAMENIYSFVWMRKETGKLEDSQKEKIRTLFLNFASVYFKWVAILPSELTQVLGEFIKLTVEWKKMEKEKFTQTIYHTLDVASNCFGVQPLSKDTKDLIKTLKNQI